MDEDQKVLFGHITEGVARMSAIIESLLALAKYGKEKLKIKPIDMTKLVDSCWIALSQGAKHTASLQLSDLPVVNADSQMVEQVVMNLLSNAIKYSSKRAQPVVKIWSEQTDVSITFFIKDNGTGFDMQNYDRLFSPFYRMHPLHEFEGNGIGLALVKNIIVKHGGSVGAESKEDEGATFYFTLPATM